MLTGICPICGMEQNGGEVDSEVSFLEDKAFATYSFECLECGTDWEMKFLFEINLKDLEENILVKGEIKNEENYED